MPSHAVRSPPIIPRPCRRTRAGAYEIDILAHEVRALADAGQRRREHLVALLLEQVGHPPPAPAAMPGAVNELPDRLAGHDIIRAIEEALVEQHKSVDLDGVG